MEGETIFAKICENRGHGTNNLAEYLALIAVLRKSLELGIKELSAYSDSELLVNQVNGKYEVKNKAILGHWEQVMNIKTKFERFSFEWIPGEQNQRADKLSKKAYHKGY